MNRHQPSTLKTIAFLVLFFTLLMTSRAANGQTPGLVSHCPGEGNPNDVVGGNNGTLQGGGRVRTIGGDPTLHTVRFQVRQ